MYPTIENVSSDNREERRNNRSRHKSLSDLPEGVMRLHQHLRFQGLVGRLYKFEGPVKNPLDREHFEESFEETPVSSFFLIGAESDNAIVYEKLSDSLCLPVCNLAKWVSGKNLEIDYHRNRYQETQELGIRPDSKVIVVNAPTEAEVQEMLDDHFDEEARQGRTIVDRGHYDQLVSIAKKFAERVSLQTA